TNAVEADTSRVGRIYPKVRRKRRGRQLTIKVAAEHFEIGKHGQVFIADIAVHRTVQILTVGSSHAVGKIAEVKHLAPRRDGPGARVLSIVELVGGRVRRWREQVWTRSKKRRK